METSDFVIYFNKVPRLSEHFLGTFSSDKIPRVMKIKTFFVSNLDPSSLPGSHWIGFVKIIPGEIEIFDSLGFRSDLILPFLKFKNNHNLTFNKTPVQNFTSNLCGKFVVTFLIERMLNQSMSFHDIIEEIFSDNLKIISNFCSELMNSS